MPRLSSRLFFGFHPPFLEFLSCALCNAGNVVCDFLWQFAVFFPRDSGLGTRDWACFLLVPFCCRRILHSAPHTHPLPLPLPLPLNSVTRKARCALRALWISLCFSITSSTAPPSTSPAPAAASAVPPPFSTSSSFSAIFICDFCVFRWTWTWRRGSCLQLASCDSCLLSLIQFCVNFISVA